MRPFIISLVMLSFLAWPSTEKIVKDSHKDKDGNSAQDQTEIEPQNGLRVTSPEAKPDAQNPGNYPQEKTQDRVYMVKVQANPPDNWYRAYVIATIVGVILALAGLRFIWKQNQTIKSQLGEMQASSKQTNRLIEQVSAGAEAALLNARAVINTERAWIIVSVKSPKTLAYEFEIENVGKTPAKFVASFCEISILERGNTLPAGPIYKTERYDGLQPILFPPKDTRIIFAKNVREPMGGQPQEQWVRSVMNGIKELYFFGCLRYIDTLAVEKGGKPVIHETKWCFKFMPIPGALPLSHPYLFPASYVDYT